MYYDDIFIDHFFSTFIIIIWIRISAFRTLEAKAIFKHITSLQINSKHITGIHYSFISLDKIYYYWLTIKQ